MEDACLSSRSNKTVEPTDTKDLHIESGQDLVTLLTCTPYMINSHRLLVRGHRIPYQPEKAAAGMKKWHNNKIYYYGHYF